ncbi:uncharacterized protein FOMMEDRAFT_155668 [Fomitiporia mediterranea MF3/22]|uniref:uncharacterized protein n=1 Tax=Fomitiporia mediterranea (strain MF3/22) TaxID=694068 RepID=UPI0004409B1E|nr:uncharacterized protein FOMMEDRAFT_155668 [Fomitiporia mediterranea MF3/22]EJD04523.1 hypothetical protein FOMMEDRAFT_155668 [Fomitiporia mediterranea MF3/22]
MFRVDVHDHKEHTVSALPGCNYFRTKFVAAEASTSIRRRCSGQGGHTSQPFSLASNLLGEVLNLEYGVQFTRDWKIGHSFERSVDMQNRQTCNTLLVACAERVDATSEMEFILRMDIERICMFISPHVHVHSQPVYENSPGLPISAQEDALTCSTCGNLYEVTGSFSSEAPEGTVHLRHRLSSSRSKGGPVFISFRHLCFEQRGQTVSWRFFAQPLCLPRADFGIRTIGHWLAPQVIGKTALVLINPVLIVICLVILYSEGLVFLSNSSTKLETLMYEDAPHLPYFETISGAVND